MSLISAVDNSSFEILIRVTLSICLSMLVPAAMLFQELENNKIIYDEIAFNKLEHNVQ